MKTLRDSNSTVERSLQILENDLVKLYEDVEKMELVFERQEQDSLKAFAEEMLRRRLDES